MTALDLTGIIPPLTTPFTRDGAIYKEGLRQLLTFHLEKGTHGLFICGTYGSGPIMSTTERKRVAEITIDHVNGKIPVIVHVGTTSTVKVIDLAKHAQEIGAYAVAAVTPFYYTYNEQAVECHFQILVETVEIPVFVYNNPKTTGFTINPDLLVKLAKLGVQGIKDSSFSFVEFTHFLIAMRDRPDFTFVIGTEALCMPAMLVGAKACISGLANVFPELVIKLFNVIHEKKYEEAARLQIKVNQARLALHIPFSTNAACYAALALRGIDVGVPKPPVLPVSNQEEDQMEDAFKKLGLM